ncbi:MAG: TlyA family RNA methyltransferase [Parvularculaceae bacterium]
MTRNDLRLDQALVERGHFVSRARAQSAIAAGLVTVNGRARLKPSTSVDAAARLEIAGDVHDYVSRGGVKLQAALDAFSIDPSGRICLDLGASTGGFTEVLLRAGALKVYAVDVGHGQLHPSLLTDARVVNLEKTHAKDLTRALIPDEVSLIVADVSFISLKKALPPALALAGPGAVLVALVKPQFEVGQAGIGKGGLVIDQDAPRRMASEIAGWLDRQYGYSPLGQIESPIAGGDGNREHLIGATCPA